MKEGVCVPEFCFHWLLLVATVLPGAYTLKDLL